MKPLTTSQLTTSQVFSLSLSLLGILVLLAVVVLIDANLQAMPPLHAQAQGFDALANVLFGSADEASPAVSVAIAQ